MTTSTGPGPGPGTVIAARYRLEDLLTESDGARFWRATDTVLARNVAIHALPSDDPRAPALLEGARVSATVNDPHLLRVLDCDDDGGVTWVVNEWGDGTSLDLMLQHGTLAPSRAAWLVREVADAIAAGHAVGVAHGRLNPEAVLVTHAGAVKLIGFVVDSCLAPPKPPDPLYGELDDREADVIDLAGILYAALTGRWPGVTPSTVPRAPREARRPLRPRQVRAGVPRTLDAICERVLHQEATAHSLPIETAQEVAAALADFVGEGTTAVEPDALHVEPTVAINRRDLTTAAEATQLSRAMAPEAVEDERPEESTGPIRDDDLESTQLHREPLEGPESLSPLRAPVVEAAPPVPPFEDVPERPLFADTERRVPARSAVMEQTGDHLTDPPGHDWGTGTGTGTGTGSPDDPAAFWPFENPDDSRNDVHTGREGRGWLRIAIIVAVLILLVVAMVYAFNRGRSTGTTPPPATNPSSSTSAGAAKAVPISGVRDFDPEGDGSENPQLTKLAIDGDPSTAWRTTTYYNRPDLGGLKSGVGLMLDLGQERSVGSVRLQLVGAPTSIELYAAPAGVTSAPTALDQLDKVGAQAGAPERTTITVTSGTRTRYLLVWLTRLPKAPGGYQGQVAEISVSS